MPATLLQLACCAKHSAVPTNLLQLASCAKQSAAPAALLLGDAVGGALRGAEGPAPCYAQGRPRQPPILVRSSGPASSSPWAPMTRVAGNW